MLRSRFDKAREAAGIEKAEFQLRDLRAKAGTDKAESSGNILQARDQLGHTAVVMAEHYITDRRGKNHANTINCGSNHTAAKTRKCLILNGARSRTRTGTPLRARDFKSPASTDFAIRAVALCEGRTIYSPSLPRKACGTCL